MLQHLMVQRAITTQNTLPPCDDMLDRLPDLACSPARAKDHIPRIPLQVQSTMLLKQRKVRAKSKSKCMAQKAFQIGTYLFRQANHKTNQAFASSALLLTTFQPNTQHQKSTNIIHDKTLMKATAVASSPFAACLRSAAPQAESHTAHPSLSKPLSLGIWKPNEKPCLISGVPPDTTWL